jgi:hypothetical protein
MEQRMNEAAGTKRDPEVAAVKTAVAQAVETCLPPQWHSQVQLGGSRAKGTATEGGDIDMYVHTNKNNVTRDQRVCVGQAIISTLWGQDYPYTVTYGRKTINLRSSTNFPDVDVVFELFNTHVKDPPVGSAHGMTHSQQQTVRYLKTMQETHPVPKVPGCELEDFVKRAGNSNAARQKLRPCMQACLGHLSQGTQVTRGSKLAVDAWKGAARKELKKNGMQ